MLQEKYPIKNSNGSWKPVSDCSDGSLLSQVQFATQQDAEHSLSQLVKNQRLMAKDLPGAKRAEILSKTAEIIRTRTPELSQLIAKEGGKPLKDAQIEAGRAATTLQLCAQEAVSLSGEQIPMESSPLTANRIAFTWREPIGVVLAISAFNHPLNLIAHQAGPAIACACPVLVKPASQTPLSALVLRDILFESGLPEKYLAVLPCSNEISEALAKDSRIAYLSFIGSSAVGWYLRSVVAPGTRVGLEHGGNAAAIVCADADLDHAVSTLIRGSFYHAGQVCISTQRIYLHQSIKQAFTEKFLNAAKLLMVGDAKDIKTDIGPIINKEAADRIMTWIEEARQGGAKIILGGNRISEKFIEATVIDEPNEDMKIMAKEIFGPVVCLKSFTDLQSAIDAVNLSTHPFQGSIYTQDLDAALTAAKEINATSVIINDHTAFRVDHMPFGGRGMAGLGMGGVKYACEELTQIKQVIMNHR